MFQPTGSKKRRKEERKSLGLQMAKDASDLSTTLCSEFRVLYSSYGLFDMGLQIKCNFHWMTFVVCWNTESNEQLQNSSYFHSDGTVCRCSLYVTVVGMQISVLIHEKKGKNYRLRMVDLLHIAIRNVLMVGQA
jgi:hypothetical protein